MRNRYLVSIVTAVLAIAFAGCSRNPDVAKRKYLESGMKYMDQEKYDSAIIQFKKALQIDPKYAEGHYQLANAYLKEGRNSDAFKEMTEVVELDPTHLKARIALGGMYMASGSHFYSNAEEQARYVTEHDPNNAEGYVLLGNVLMGEKHLDEALSSFSKAIALKPDDASAYLNRGAAYAFLKQDEPAEQDFRKAISVDPHLLQGYANLAGFYLYKKDPKKAEEIYRQAIQN
ncbi:MAG: tetratricopeptide repeat protein, partial [Candidatus Korobacteraceae bacterium]